MESVPIRRKGVVTIPKRIRERFGLRESDVLSVVALDDGSILLTPLFSQVARHGDQVAAMMAEAGVSLDDMMEQLDEERKRYYRQHYRKGTEESGQTEEA